MKVPAITTELIASATHDDLYDALDRTIFAHLKKSDDDDSALQTLPQGLQLMWHLMQIEFEVPNGGFSQFFYNTSGSYAIDTLEALRVFGFKKRARALEKALQLFQDKVGRPRTSRERWLTGNFPDEADTDKLDIEYYRAMDSENMQTLIDYVRQHPDKFLYP